MHLMSALIICLAELKSHEVYDRYETESNLEEIIDYLVKTPHLLEQIERVTLLKSKTRKHVEELLISNIEHIFKIIE